MAASTVQASAALAPIAKAAQYFVGAVAVAVVGALSDGHVTTLEGLQAFLAGLTAGAVYVAAVAWLKNVVAAAMLGVQFLVAHVTVDGGLGDLQQAQWIMLGIIVLNSLGVIFVPNEGAEPASGSTALGTIRTP